MHFSAVTLFGESTWLERPGPIRKKCIGDGSGQNREETSVEEEEGVGFCGTGIRRILAPFPA